MTGARIAAIGHLLKLTNYVNCAVGVTVLSRSLKMTVRANFPVMYGIQGTLVPSDI